MLGVLSRFEKELRTFKELLRSRDPKALGHYLDKAQKIRERL